MTDSSRFTKFGNSSIFLCTVSATVVFCKQSNICKLENFIHSNFEIQVNVEVNLGNSNTNFVYHFITDPLVTSRVHDKDSSLWTLDDVK